MCYDKNMKLEELVGRTLVVGLPGLAVTAEQITHLRAIHAGGFIPFERNFQSPEQFKKLVADLNSALGRELLVMVDHEGGRIIRFSNGVTAFPEPLMLGRDATPDRLKRQGMIEARELKALGAHLNLAPCVDVLVEGSDPVIGDRSYGTDPRRVAELAVARIQGIQSQGVAACAKHFPGLGAVPKDPHKQLPTLQLEWTTMRATHLVPFMEAITCGVATIMSSHVCYPKLDESGVPATFSPRLIRILLRDEMGFRGVIVTDDLEMGALHALCPIGEAAVRAVEAGHQLLLVCHRPAAQREVHEALVTATRSGRLSTQELERTVEQLERLRRRSLSNIT